jgi:hypothetical protein
MNAYMGSTGMNPLVLKHGTRWRLMVNCTPRWLYTRERAPVPTSVSWGVSKEGQMHPKISST